MNGYLRQIQKALAFIEEHLDEELRPEGIALNAGIRELLEEIAPLLQSRTHKQSSNIQCMFWQITNRATVASPNGGAVLSSWLTCSLRVGVSATT